MAWIDGLFKRMAEAGASDLHISSGCQPMFRIDGDIAPVEGVPELTAKQMNQALLEICPERNWDEFGEKNDTDFAYELEDVGRFRANYFMDRKGPGAVFRIIPSDILTAQDLGLPQAVTDLCYLTKGLVVVTGPTGSGKSTTLAAMVDFINKSRSDHIITIEDPIEFVHDNHRCLVNQREVHRHTAGFKTALRAALREDPDIVLVGEMRDLETIEIALETAETGHLVFGTLHTTTAPSTVDRIIDQFPADRQAQIRTMLASSLKGVIAQTLCKRVQKGRRAALEIMIVNSAVSANIREGKTHQIPTAMQMGGKLGMKSLNDALLELVQSGEVAPEEAYMKAVNKQEFGDKMKRVGIRLDMTKISEGTSPAASAAADEGTLDAPEAPLPKQREEAPADPFANLGAETPTGSGAGSGSGGGGAAPADPFEEFKRKRGT